MSAGPATKTTPIDAAALFRAHAPAVARVLHRAGIPRREIDDLVQEVFLVAHRRGGFTPGQARATTWLAKIALRLAANYRRKSRVAPADPSHGEALPGGETADSGGAVARAQHALWAMDEGKRLVFLLFELEGVSGEEIAASLQIPVGTVYSRLHAARRAFVEAMAEGGERS